MFMNTQFKLVLTNRFLLSAVTIIFFFITSQAHAYSDARISNNTDFDWSVIIKYAGCENDSITVKRRSTVKASRGACLITGIEALNGTRLPEAKKDRSFMSKYKPLVKKLGTAVAKQSQSEMNKVQSQMELIKGYDSYFAPESQAYDSSGTSYANFYINKYKNQYRVMSEAEYRGNGVDYPFVTLKNHTKSPMRVTVKYSSAFCDDDTFTLPAATYNKDKISKYGEWTATSRGVCLVDGIVAKATKPSLAQKPHLIEKITPYGSTGTSYSQFAIQLYGGGYRVYGEEEFKREISRQNSVKSPGFKIHNRTNYPLNISLEQAGCLYHGIINPEVDGGKPFVRNTGAIWFDIRAKVVPYGSAETSDWECIEPVAQIVFDVASTLLLNPGLTAALKNAVKAGGNIIMKAGIKKGAQEVAKRSAKEAIKSALKSTAKKASSYVVKKGKTIIRMSAKELAEETAKKSGEFFVKQNAKFLIANVVPNQSFEVKLDKTAVKQLKKLIDLDPVTDIDQYAKAMDTYTNTFTKLSDIQWEAAKPIRETVRRAEFSGYEWPVRCDRMPEYEVIGGPDGLDWTKGEYLIIRKLNICGNNMTDNYEIDAKRDETKTSVNIKKAKERRAAMIKAIESEYAN